MAGEAALWSGSAVARCCSRWRGGERAGGCTQAAEAHCARRCAALTAALDPPLPTAPRPQQHTKPPRQVSTFLRAQGREAGRTAVIHANPEQSKHLETARMRIGDTWVDFVNLRCESYAEGSRIPQVAFGTPEQDALRRDFTVNALFYNLNDGAVEDLTGRGLEDLRAGVLRTPLPPLQTFMDGAGSLLLTTLPARPPAAYRCPRSLPLLRRAPLRLPPRALRAAAAPGAARLPPHTFSRRPAARAARGALRHALRL